MISIKMYKADEGDSFLVSIDNEKFNVLIDMGFEETYKKFIKKDLEDLAKRGKSIDLLVITHIDNDHISGALNFIYENGENMKIINVKEVWHNSYKHLNFEKKIIALPKEELKVLNKLKQENNLPFKTDGLSDIGAKEGSTLAGLLYKYNYNWNTSFNNKAVCIENADEINFGDIKFILISPDIGKLNKLANKWKEKLTSIFHDFKLTEDEIFDEAFELYIKNLPPEDYVINDISSDVSHDLKKLASKNEIEYSAQNGSSIAFIIEIYGKKLLFLADAHHTLVTEQLEILKKNGYELDFEIIKVSHHGSNKNISTELISLIESKKYLFSTNGKKNQHPEVEALSKIILKETSYIKEMYFNYYHKKLSFLEDDELRKIHNYRLDFSNETITI